jgi:CRP/FNR family transcriptional regulator, cyclic AMP receptor protein
MRGPYGFELSDNCRTCKLKGTGSFCQLESAALNGLDSITSAAAYPDGAILFLEQQASRGVFVLCDGEVKLTVTSSEGKTMILRVARAGEILGLQSVLSGQPYEVTAETLHPCQVAFIPRDSFLRFMEQHQEVSRSVIKQLTAQYQAAYEQLRTVGLASSPHEKLAKLLLRWASAGQRTSSGTKIKLPLTHEEMGECIGVTRETVTRTLGEFKHQRLVTIQGSTLMISNPAALENFVTA